MPTASRGSFTFLFRIVVVIAVQLTGTAMMAQASGNPFDLKPRLGQMPESTGPATADLPTGNPFDIIAPEKGVSLTPPRKPVQQGAEEEETITPPEPLEAFILGLVIFSFLLLTILVTLFREYFGKIVRAIGNDGLLSQAQREFQQGQRLPYLVLYLTFMVNAGIALFLLIRRVFELNFGLNNYSLLFLCILTVAAAFLFKHLLLFFTGRVFPVQKEVDLYSFTIIVFSIFIGISLFAGNVLLGLGNEKILVPGAIVIGIFVGAVYFFRSIRGLLIGSRFIPLHIFHFLLYICTAEIAPVAVVGKLILNSF